MVVIVVWGRCGRETAVDFIFSIKSSFLTTGAMSSGGMEGVASWDGAGGFGDGGGGPDGLGVTAGACSLAGGAAPAN